jgi:hypothetical protein
MRRIPRRQQFVIIGQVGDACGGITRALVVRYGDVLVSERYPKIGSSKRSSPEDRVSRCIDPWRMVCGSVGFAAGYCAMTWRGVWP